MVDKIDKEQERNILDFFNSVEDAEEIINAIKDDPDFGIDSPLAYGVRRDTAERILQVREDLGGEFTSIEQIDQIRGIGPDTLHDIKHSIAPPSQSYPVLLFPIRLETRFKGNDLWVRIYSDDVLIQKHDGRLTPDEVQSLEQYQEALNQANTKDKKKEAWHGLVERVGRTRAAYLHRINDINAAGRKSDSWEKSPYIRVLPDHFLVCLYQGEELKYEVRGAQIKKELPLIADANTATTDTDPLYGDHAKWVYDFNEAEKNGMAVKITLSNNEAEFSRVVVLGLTKNSNPSVGQKYLENLFEDHRFTSGVSFVPYGTPTNNTEALTTDYIADEKDAQLSFDVESQKLTSGSVGIELAKALGIETRPDKCPFAYVRNAAIPYSSHDQHIRAALWPALGDYFLAHMLRPSMPVEYREQIWRHFQHFVQARGPYSTVRIGKQPYGIIPVTDLSNWQPSELDSLALDSNDSNSYEFFAKFHKILLLLFRYWLTTAEDETSIPRIGQSGDTDEELLQILSMQPASIDQKVRAIVDDRFLASLIRFLGENFFGRGSNIEPGTGTDDPMKLWGELLYESQAGARGLLKEIAQQLNIGEEDILQSPILRLFGWVESVPLWNQNTEELIPFVADPDPTRPSGGPIDYLKRFHDPNIIPEADSAKPLLFNLLRRAMLYQQNEGYPFRDQGFIPFIIKYYDLFYTGIVQEILVSKNDEVSKDTVLLKIEIKERAAILDIKAPGDGVIEKIHVKVNDLVQNGKELIALKVYRHVNHTVSDTTIKLDVFKDDLRSLEALVSDTLDLHTHRLDAWLTSLATKRLTAMRQRTKFEQGVYVGAYGWVENLERDQQTFSENSGGYIHAHSLGQAAAGAALRNAYLSEIEEDQNANALRINLSSNRIRRASRIMEGRRQGQEMGALLGYQFERALHDSMLDKYIDNIRAIYPIVASQVTEPEGNQPVETIAARNVVDGLKLTRGWEAYLSDETPQSEKEAIKELWDRELGDAHNISIDALKDDPANKLSIQLNRLLDSLDGLADLLLYESVYQEVQGNYERSAAALDAMSGEGLPPEPESIQTPQNGVPFTQRISLMFKPHTGASNGYRDSAEPTLADWFSNVLVDMTKIGCVAEVLEYRDEYDEVLSTKKIINLNQATFKKLESLPGIGTSLAQDIIDDRTKNGFYKRIEDLTRVSGIGDEKIEGLKDLATVERVELNRATHSELQQLLGLSDEPATAIIDDRTANGHYTSVNNLKRVEAIDETTFERLKSRLMVTMVDLNKATKEELVALPGIEDARARDIIDDRNTNGNFNTVRELKRVNGIGDALVEGLRGLTFVTEPLKIFLDNLNLNPLDFLYLSHATPAALASALGFKQPAKEAMRAGNTEIEQRIRNYVSDHNLLDPNCVITIVFHPVQGVFERSIGEALEMARTVLDMISSSKYLSPLTFRRPEESGTDPVHAWDYNELCNRVDSALDELKKLKDDARWNSSPVDTSIYFEVSQFGIDNAISPSPLRDPHPDRKKAMLEAIEKRITQCEQYVEDADKLYSDGALFSEKAKAIDKLDRAMKALFGNAFVTLPTLRPLRTDESTDHQKELLKNIKEASDQPDILGNNDEQRINLWLQQVAQAHPSIQQLETVMMVTEAWQQPVVTDTTNCTTTSIGDVASLQWKILQLPYDDKRRWLALSDAELQAGLTQEEIDTFQTQLTEDGRERGVLSFVTASPDPIDFGKKITGLLIDDWNEWIPAPNLRTGVAFQYDRPNAQAPQALLLAVPPVLEKDKERPWTYQSLLNIVNDTINLAKIRAVDIDALGSAENRFFPATMIPSDADNPGWVRDVEMPGLDDWLNRDTEGCIDFRTMPINEKFSDRQQGPFHLKAHSAFVRTHSRYGDMRFLRISHGQIVISLNNDVNSLRLRFGGFPEWWGSSVDVELKNVQGAMLKRLTRPLLSTTIERLNVNVEGIRQIIMTGGGDALALFEICVGQDL